VSVSTTDGAALVAANGGFVQWALDRSTYIFNSSAPQVIYFATASSAALAVQALANAGFQVAQWGGGPAYPRDGLSTTTPMQYWRAVSS